MLELILAAAICSIVGISAGNLFQYHGKLMTEATTDFQNNINSEVALGHILDNVRSSSWVVVKSENEIELHSHSYPRLRSYVYNEGTLKYFEEGRATITLAEKLKARRFFSGLGDQKSGAKFREVEVEFWNEGKTTSDYYENDLFYAKTDAVSRESWNFIYVDPENGASYQDGTRQFPYHNLADGLNAVSEDDALAESLIIKSGNHQLYGDVELRGQSLCFAANTSLDIEAGTNIGMGVGTMIVMEGTLRCNGTKGDMVTFRPLNKVTGWQNMWSGIILADPTGARSGQTTRISYVDISGSTNGFLFQNYSRDIVFSENYVHDNYSGFSVYGAETVSAYNNAFSSGELGYGRSISLNSYYWGQSRDDAIDIEYNVYNNEFDGGYGVSVYNYSFNEDSDVESSLYGNTFENMRRGVYAYSYARGEESISKVVVYDNVFTSPDTYGNFLTLNSSGKGTILQEVTGNKIELDNESESEYWWQSSTGINVYSWGWGDYTPSDDSQITITNNYIDLAGSGRNGIYVSAKEMAVELSNNDISGSRDKLSDYTWDRPAGILVYLAKDLVVRNNIIHDNGYYDILILGPYNRSEYQNNVSIENNVLYGSGGGILSTKYNGSYKSANVSMSNNTLYGVSVEDTAGNSFTSITNCILWSDDPCSSNLNGLISNSVVKGLALGGTNTTETPPFVAGDDGYHLQDGETWMTGIGFTTTNGNEVGAYGGVYSQSWGESGE